jgi:hypothetical protein
MGQQGISKKKWDNKGYPNNTKAFTGIGFTYVRIVIAQ